MYSKTISNVLLFSLLFTWHHAFSQETVVTERNASDNTGWYQRSNVSIEALSELIDAKNLRVIDLDINTVSPFRVSAALVKNTKEHKKGWWWYTRLSGKELNERLKEKKARILDLEVYQLNGQTRFAAVMVPNKGASAVGSWWYGDKTPKQLSELLKKNKARLIDLERYRKDNKTRYAAVMVRNTGPLATEWWWYRGQTLAQLEGKLKGKKARERYKTSKGTLLDAVLVPYDNVRNNRQWHYYGVSSDKLVELARRHGARLTDIEPPAYGATGYSATLIDNGMAKQGDCSSKLKALDQKVVKMMKKHGVPGATVAVVKGDKLVHACGYGHADVSKDIPMKVESRMRLASISKLLTVSALRKLEQDNDLNLDSKMIKQLGAAKPAGPYKDNKIKNITIQHLIDHRGGWDRGMGLNPMFMSNQIASEFGTPRATGCKTVMRYMFQKEKLDFKPGGEPTHEDSDKYSNFGYCILGRVVENASGQRYHQYVRDAILAPIGIKKMRIGRGLKKHRFADEPQYYGKPFAKPVVSVYPNTPAKLLKPNGGFHLEAMDSHGGWIGSAIDTARYLAFAKPSPVKSEHGGALWGTRSQVKKIGDVTVAVLMNYWVPNNENFSSLISNAIAEVDGWPNKNLWTKYGYNNP